MAFATDGIVEMPKIQTGDISAYYEIHGDGDPLVFVHGGWVSHEMWKPQVKYFSKRYRVITYDIRGHGNTGLSTSKRYSMELFADDLAALMEALEVRKPVICGLSMGGMIAQIYAIKYPHNLKTLILSDTAVSSALTLSDKITKYILAPKWLFLLLVKLLGVKRYTNFAFWYARKTRSDKWVGLDQNVAGYEKEEMLRFDTGEFNKIFAAIYDFKLQDLSKIQVKTLVLNGEFESKAVFRHTEMMEELIPDTMSAVIPNAGHSSNMENPGTFNRVIAEFLKNAEI